MRPARLEAFADGVFANRTRKPEEIPEATPAMKGIRLIGFLSPENGHWALSLHWKQGSLAVLRKPGLPDEQALILTTVTQSFVLDAPTETRSHTAPRIFKRPEAPPTFRRPSPPSMTRLMPAAAPKLY